MAISERVREQMQRSSWIRRMFEEGRRLRAEHGDAAVIDLSLGNPEIEPPRAFQDALRRAVADERTGLHRYMPNAGFPSVREAVARHFRAESGLPVTEDDIVMVCGAAAGLNVIFKSILNPADEVILLAPYFPEYIFYIDNHGGIPRPVPTREDFSIDLEAVGRALHAGTRAVLLNSPSNPSGHVYSKDEVQGLARLLRERASRCYLVADEPYKRLLFDGRRYAGILDAYDRSIVVGSHSKDLAIPGERIGQIVFSPRIAAAERRELFDAANFANRTLGFVNAPALMQRVVAELQGVSVDPLFYQARRDVLCDGLEAMGYRFVRPGVAFYLFMQTPMADDVAFVRELAERLVLTVPGSGFGTPGHIRISFCVAMERIERAMPAFRELATRHGLALSS